MLTKARVYLNVDDPPKTIATTIGQTLQVLNNKIYKRRSKRARTLSRQTTQADNNKINDKDTSKDI